MNGGMQKAKAAGAVQAVVPAKTVGAEADSKMPNAVKQVEARKAVVRKLLKKKITVVSPKTRCFAQRPVTVTKAQSLSAAIPALSPTLQLPVIAGGASLTSLETGMGLLSRLWRWVRSRQVARSGSRRLHVASTASLGEKRFVAVIQIDGLQFLIGGGATNVVLLAKLDVKKSFGALLNKEKAARDTQPTFEQAEARA